VEQSGSNAPEGAQQQEQRTRIDRRVRPTNSLMNLKSSIKFRGDNLRQYENGQNLDQKVRAGLLNAQHIQGLRCNRLLDSLKTVSLGKLMDQMNV
jgi:hypothetical protein